MYSVTKRIDFCYGHRHSDTLDARNMVVDFGEIKRIVKGWIDRELDHKMILRHDDPLAQAMQALGDPVFLLDSNPTAERIARLIFDVSREQGLPVTRVTLWETPTSWATYAA
jgi:6-pyruvoyltetrahydropterin/6-carboxytetrahydropterin synthase